MTPTQRALLWDEINRYAVSCGGDPSQYVYGNKPRQVAVSQIEAIIREIEAAWANDIRRVAEAETSDPPHVCPGCYAVGEEPCLSWCIDDALDREREEAIQRGDYDYTEEP